MLLNLLMTLLIPSTESLFKMSGRGIFGDMFKKLFDFLLGIITFLGNLIWSAIKWLGQQIAKLFNFLFDLLIAFFTVIYDLIAGLLYFLYKIGVLAVKLFSLILETAKLLWSFVVGLTRTMGQLVYSPSGSSPNNVMSSEIGRVMTFANNYLQLAPVAYILAFLVWVTTAVLVVRIVSTIKNA